MNRWTLKTAMVFLSSSLLAGCAASTYQTNASDTQLSAYAGAAVFPQQLKAAEAPHLFCVVAPDATITLYNSGDESYTAFELWVNQLYTLHVAKLDPKGFVIIDPGTIYGRTGNNLKGVPGSSINQVQVFQQDKLWTVQGPIVMH